MSANVVSGDAMGSSGQIGRRCWQSRCPGGAIEAGPVEWADPARDDGAVREIRSAWRGRAPCRWQAGSARVACRAACMAPDVGAILMIQRRLSNGMQIWLLAALCMVFALPALAGS